MNEKQQQLTFNKGITNVPSDALCSDNTLEDSIGMVYDDGEHRVIQKPVASGITFETGHKFLYVHKIGATKVYITVYNNRLYYRVNNGSILITDNVSVVQDTTVTSIGKTLIVNSNGIISYFLWKGNGYSVLASPLPDLNFQAELYISEYNYAKSSSSCDQIINWDGENHKWNVADGAQETYNDLVTGLYAKNKKSLENDKRFCEPFFVRAALELYDGSYTFITNPILLFPCVNKNSYGYVQFGMTFSLITYGAYLQLRQETDYSDYSDIVKDVVVFASKGAMVYNTDGDQTIETPGTSVVEVANYVGVLLGGSSGGRNKFGVISVESEQSSRYNKLLTCLKQRSNNDIKGDLVGTSIFYKICSLGLKPTGGFVDAGSKISEYVLPNLTTQEQLPYDDYYSRSELRADGMYTYNGRLNIYGVQRGMFKGFTYFMPLDNDSGSNYKWYVQIKTETGTVWLEKTGFTTQNQSIYFFYPDTRAVHVVIVKQVNGTYVRVFSKDLIAHSGLNGAYYLDHLPNASDNNGESTWGSDDITPNNNFFESLPNYLLTSEVNNPWVFKASGYNCIGNGRILGLSTTTTALSEGQFGQYPLLVFSEDGIWAFSLDGTGLYTSIRPMSREVCNNPKSITQTDGAVFFVSKKGLMMIVGSQVKCVSEQLSGNGNAFRELLKNAVIAYDYRDSLLWIFETANGGSQFCYIFSIKSGTFARFKGTATNFIVNVVNDYPDYLLQRSTNILTLLNRPDINDDNDTYEGSLTSRPMKLENALALKSIIQVKHILDANTNARLVFKIYASNNLRDWCEITSMRGTPWKYYRFEYTFYYLKATDRFAGTMLITQERRTNRLR